MNNQEASYERYQRQIILKNFGEEGQQKLLQGSVLIVGAGGLGCPALQYLAAAGVGKIGIVDDDVVSLHNLHRQVLYATPDVGLPKAVTAAKRLAEMNPGVRLVSYPFRFTVRNALNIISEYNIVLDATDNFATRYLVNDACALLKTPLVHGAISAFEGQVAVFNAGAGPANYRDLFPQPPLPGSALNCAEAGVLGILPGIIGTMQATEVIKLITGIGRPLVNRLLTYDALTHDSHIFDLVPRAGPSSAPGDAGSFEAMDYDWLCSASAAVEEIESSVFDELLRTDAATVIDVREAGEQPTVHEFHHLHLPLSQLKSKAPLPGKETLVLFCQSGSRSREAARILSSAAGGPKKIYSLKGGILRWKLNHGKEA